MQNRRETNGIQGEPLCGWGWIEQHRNDHTHEEIEALSIQMSIDGRTLPEIRAGNGKDKVKDIVRSLR